MGRRGSCRGGAVVGGAREAHRSRPTHKQRPVVIICLTVLFIGFFLDVAFERRDEETWNGSEISLAPQKLKELWDTHRVGKRTGNGASDISGGSGMFGHNSKQRERMSCVHKLHFLFIVDPMILNANVWTRYFASITDHTKFSVHVYCEGNVRLCKDTLPPGLFRDNLVPRVKHEPCRDSGHINQLLLYALYDTYANRPTNCQPGDHYIIVRGDTVPVKPFDILYERVLNADTGFCVHEESKWQSAAWRTGFKGDWIPRTSADFAVTTSEASAMIMSQEANAWNDVCSSGKCCSDNFWPYVASHGLVTSNDDDTVYSSGSSLYMGINTSSVIRKLSSTPSGEGTQGFCWHTYRPKHGIENAGKGGEGDYSATHFAALVEGTYDTSFGDGSTSIGPKQSIWYASVTTWKLLRNSPYLFAGSNYGMQSTWDAERVDPVIFLNV